MMRTDNPNCFPLLTEFQFMQMMWKAWEEKWDEVTCLECRATKEQPVYLKFSPHHCAHVLSKGSLAAARKDVRNLIPLCIKHHRQMDDGIGQLTRKDMKIWPFVEEIIAELKKDYS